MGRSAARRTGRVLTGFGSLVVLCAVLVGAPVALLAFAGNPLPDHVPTITEVGAVLTSRDDGQLFLRALALAGWFGWATFAFSVLVELGAQALRRPAPRLPGMSRQQRAAAALVGSVALIVAASPAASAAAVAGAPSYAAPAASAAVAQAVPGATTAIPPRLSLVTGPVAATATAPVRATRSAEVPVYRVAKGDYLGAVAERYLDEFADYRELARLNRLGDPDRIRPGQLLKLPEQATDRGARPHATGHLVARPAPARPAPPAAPSQATPGQETSSAAPAPPAAEAPRGEAPAMTVGAARVGEPDRVNRPLAVSAVLAVASIVGAQIGAVLGLRRRPAAAGARLSVPGRARAGTTARGGLTGRGATRNTTARGGPAGGGATRGRGGAAAASQARAHASAAEEPSSGRHRRD
ncbi:LysM domain-containing protein [Micromonospora sp. NPDC048909]|uniref:LysM peptidoglycan-binding domain-containing protein n=1 Tax=Micromonospora sp. NPDC048909 TaxID=3155643 RepID=UPI0033F6161F